MLEVIQSINAVIFMTLPLCLAWILASRRAGRSPFDPEGLLVVYPLYCVFQVILMKSLHYLHVLDFPMIAGAYLLLNLILIAFLIRTPACQTAAKSGRANGLPERSVIVCAAMVLALIGAVTLLKPLHLTDENSYHMPMVVNYLQNHSLDPWPTQCLRQILRPNVAELQMLNLAFLSQSDAWMELFQTLALGVILTAVFQIARLQVNSRTLAFLVVLVVLSAPQMLLGAGTANNDLTMVAVTLCAFYWLLKAVLDPTHPHRSMFLVGISAALAAGTKVLGICTFGTVFIVIVLLVLRKTLSPKSLSWFLFYGLLALGLIAGEIYWRNYLHSRIPFGIVAGEDTTNNFIFSPAIFKYLYDYYIVELCFNRLFLQAVQDHGRSHFGYLFPILFVLGTLTALKQLFSSRSKRSAGIWTFSLCTFMLFFSITAFRKPVLWDQRFMVWMVPAFALLSLPFFQKWPEIWLSRLSMIGSAAVLVYFVFVYNTAFSFGYVTRSSIDHFFRHGELARIGQVADATWVRPRLMGFAVLDKQARSTDKVLFIGAGETIMYPAWGRHFTRIVTGVTDLPDALEKIRSGKYRFVIVEAKTEKVLRDTSLATIRSLGYVRISKTKKQVIYERSEH